MPSTARAEEGSQNESPYSLPPALPGEAHPSASTIKVGRLSQYVIAVLLVTALTPPTARAITTLATTIAGPTSIRVVSYGFAELQRDGGGCGYSYAIVVRNPNHRIFDSKSGLTATATVYDKVGRTITDARARFGNIPPNLSAAVVGALRGTCSARSMRVSLGRQEWSRQYSVSLLTLISSDTASTGSTGFERRVICVEGQGTGPAPRMTAVLVGFRRSNSPVEGKSQQLPPVSFVEPKCTTIEMPRLSPPVQGEQIYLQRTD